MGPRFVRFGIFKHIVAVNINRSKLFEYFKWTCTVIGTEDSETDSIPLAVSIRITQSNISSRYAFTQFPLLQQLSNWISRSNLQKIRISMRHRSTINRLVFRAVYFNGLQSLGKNIVALCLRKNSSKRMWSLLMIYCTGLLLHEVQQNWNVLLESLQIIRLKCRCVHWNWAGTDVTMLITMRRSRFVSSAIF